MGKRDFIKQFGKNIVLRIRKRNGETVELDFPSPQLVRNPEAFNNGIKHKDPLAVRD